MATGKVKWYDSSKGYGFITNDDGSGDLFVHHSQVPGDSRDKTLEKDAKIQFDIVEGKKGIMASNVCVIADAAPVALPAE